jgi:DMSO/TMAO reductase YedYZ molybdopterin-dependent catalytic subunit
MRMPELAERLRLGPLKEGAFTSRLHAERLAAILGLALGVSFSICFITGVLSHLIQDPPSWFVWPADPPWLYRVIQGLHVATGLASVPLLVAKLWTVYPRLWTWPVLEDVTHLVERVSLVPLVAGSVFLLFTGVADIALWYPWRFFFTAGHYWAAWITMGALVVHVGAKATMTRRALTRSGLGGGDETGGGLTRRGFLGVVAAATGLITVSTVGQTFKPLSRVGLLAPRRPSFGPQGFPVNKSALSAGVLDTARDPGWRLSVEGEVDNPLCLSLDDLHTLPQHEANLAIACVEGWSASARWRGVRVADLLDLARASEDATVRVEALQDSGLYRVSELNRLHARDPDTLIALEVNGETLHIDHGFPARLIGPNRPGVMQTKWVSKLVVL